LSGELLEFSHLSWEVVAGVHTEPELQSGDRCGLKGVLTSITGNNGKDLDSLCEGGDCFPIVEHCIVAGA